MDLARYAELFRTEVREHLAGMDGALLALADGRQEGAVDELFRATHTIKGMAGAMGYSSVEQMSHATETLLAAVRETRAPADATLIALLYEATDALAQHVDDAVDGHDTRVVSLPLLERLASVADSLDGGRESRTTGTWRVPIEELQAELHRDVQGGLEAEFDAAQTAEETPGTLAGERTAGARLVVVTLAPDAPLKSVRAQIVLARLEQLGAVQGTEPTVQTLTDAFDGVFTVAITSTHSDRELEAAARSAGDVQRVSVRAPAVRRAVRDVLRHVRIDLKRIDALLDLVGELVISRDRLLSVADATGDRQVIATAQDMSRLVSALQDEILQARMVPVGQVFDRFPRLVRDVARDLGKEIVFTMEGRDITLDRSMLDAIGDPIVHLLRNAIDHGFESAEERVAAGKTESGKLVLRAVRDRAAIVIAVEDDGRGIDRDRILAKAIAEGRADHTLTSLSDDDLVKVLAQPGFSTAASVTSVSGRGVGIDVVASRVRALGGALDIETTPGEGTTFLMRLPLTLAIVRALLVQVGERTYAVPTAHVVEAVEFDDVDRQTIEGREAVNVRGELFPLVRLRLLFGDGPGDDAGAQLIVVDAGGQRVACKVDALVGQQDIVVKQFDAVRGATAHFSGATILGDGSPALIVDVGSLA